MSNRLGTHYFRRRDMSAFGKKNGLGGGRSSFGVAKPMSGSGGSRSGTDRDKPYALGGSQFPSIDAGPLPGEQHGHDIPEPVATNAPDKDDATPRLAERS